MGLRGPKPINLVGARRGRLVVISQHDILRSLERRWRCKCDCGQETITRTSQLRPGNTVSCGCVRVEQLVKRHTRHGLSRTAEYSMLYRAQRSARLSGFACDITIADIVIPDVCPALGIPLIRRNPGDGCRLDNTPSLDRIDNSLGYVRGNIAVISWRANQLKRDASIAELVALAAWAARARGNSALSLI